MVAAVAVATLVSWAIFGPVALAVGAFALVAILAAVFIEFQRRTDSRLEAIADRVADMHRDREHLLRDIEGLIFLYQQLEPGQPLPPFRKATINPDFALRLVGEILSREAPQVVELGSGVSTVIAALAVKRRGAGKVVSYEAEEKYRELTAAMLKRYGVAEHVALHLAPLKPQSVSGEDWPWYSLPEGSLPAAVDVLLVDGPPRTVRADARYPALPLLHAKLRAGAIVYLDDGARPDETRIAERWLKEYPELHREPLETRSGVIALRKS